MSAVARLAEWNAANERARQAYDADQTAASPKKVTCSSRCGRRTEHPSGTCAPCRRAVPR